MTLSALALLPPKKVSCFVSVPVASKKLVALPVFCCLFLVPPNRDDSTPMPRAIGPRAPASTPMPLARPAMLPVPINEAPADRAPDRVVEPVSQPAPPDRAPARPPLPKMDAPAPSRLPALPAALAAPDRPSAPVRPCATGLTTALITGRRTSVLNMLTMVSRRLAAMSLPLSNPRSRASVMLVWIWSAALRHSAAASWAASLEASRAVLLSIRPASSLRASISLRMAAAATSLP